MTIRVVGSRVSRAVLPLIGQPQLDEGWSPERSSFLHNLKKATTFWGCSRDRCSSLSNPWGDGPAEPPRAIPISRSSLRHSGFPTFRGRRSLVHNLEESSHSPPNNGVLSLVLQIVKKATVQPSRLITEAPKANLQTVKKVTAQPEAKSLDCEESAGSALLRKT